MKDCIFCQIYKEKRDIVYQDKFFYVQFDAYPASPGHLEIIPIRHIVSILELKTKEWKQLKKTVSKTIEIIEKKDFKNLYQKMLKNPLNDKSKIFCQKMLDHFKIGEKPDGYNIGVNEGRSAGRSIDHLHIHVIPRFSRDVEDPIGGIRRVIPGMMNYIK